MCCSWPRRSPGPARLYGLAKLGFTQSYSYFTWRTAKGEITEFGEEIAEHADEARPNLFVNTPDILHESLQHGGPGMFAIRAVLASTLSPLWGVYSGFELFEHQPVRAGSEEYLDSEKYELRPRDFEAALAQGRSLEPFLTQLNEIRRLHPSLREMRTIRFHAIDNDALLAYSKFDPTTGDCVLVVVTINPYRPEESTITNAASRPIAIRMFTRKMPRRGRLRVVVLIAHPLAAAPSRPAPPVCRDNPPSPRPTVAPQPLPRPPPASPSRSRH